MGPYIKCINKYIASLEKQLTKTSKYVKEHTDELQDIQVNLDNLEQYSKKNSLEFHGIPDEVNMPTDLVLCKIARAIGVEIQENDIGRRRGTELDVGEETNQSWRNS